MVKMKHVQIEWAGDTAIDGQAKPAGEFHIKEFEDDEWVGGSYASFETLSEKVWELLADD
jgi:hypothetical protein